MNIPSSSNNAASKSKTVLYSLSFVALGIVSGSIGPTLPALAEHANVGMKQISNLFVARSLGTVLGSWLLGRMYDRFAGHPLLAVSLLASAAAMAFIPVSNHLWVLIALSVFIGLASASINVGGNTLIVMVHGQQVRPFISLLHFAFGIGGILAPLVVSVFAHRADGLQLAYWMFALLSLPPALMALVSASPAHRIELNGENNPPIPKLTLTLLVFFFFLEIGAEASVMGWLYSYALKQNISPKTATQINSAFWAAFTVGRLATIWLSMRVSALPMVVINLGLTVLFAVALLIVPASPALLWTCSIGLGLFVAPIFPSTFGYAQNKLHLSGNVNGLFLFGSAGGAMFWPRLVGQYFDSQGAQVMTWIVLFALIGALAIILLLSFPLTHSKNEKLTA